MVFNYNVVCLDEGVEYFCKHKSWKVRPRVKELRDESLVVLDAVIKDDVSGISTQFWKINEVL